ncbi:extracellular solute-binding protein [Actinomadura viridis]|uniref:Raffinose/stachyose/melibiose transport system substrate-binding protein n=1 Tax=Actinomadura viridis TaxID=58110 RepID=A0A931GNF1_9ACTN|nr:extracellular solute-binding protein [Actinomadura viridis]MBG6092900.1 raffinose/stachyose/melibiose transport system substrate-binding protein [Actinomadura viridis]
MGTDARTRRSFLSAVSAGSLAVAASPLLGACGGSGSDGDGKTTLEWWDNATTEPQKSLYPQLIQAFQAARPDVTIKITNLENEAYKAKMTAVTASGKLPDIFMTWGGGVLKQQVDAGLVEDLTSRAADLSATLTPISQQAYRFDGKTWAIPNDIGMVGFWYNKRLFAKAGIKAPPATWSELLDGVRKLKSAGITPIALAGKEKWPGHYYWAYLALRIGGTAALKQAETSKDFSAPAFVGAGQRLKELVDLAPFQPGFQGAGYATPGGQAATMGAGQAAMELMGQWAPNVQRDTGKDLGEDLGFFPFPMVEGGQGSPGDIFGGGSGHALRKGAPAAAYDFLKFLLQPDNERKLITSGAFMPVVKGAESAITDPNRRLVAETVARASGFQLYLDQAFPPAVGQEVNDGVADLVAGRKTPEQVAAEVTRTAKSQ